MVLNSVYALWHVLSQLFCIKLSSITVNQIAMPFVCFQSFFIETTALKQINKYLSHYQIIPRIIFTFRSTHYIDHNICYGVHYSFVIIILSILSNNNKEPANSILSPSDFRCCVYNTHSPFRTSIKRKLTDIFSLFQVILLVDMNSEIICNANCCNTDRYVNSIIDERHAHEPYTANGLS